MKAPEYAPVYLIVSTTSIGSGHGDPGWSVHFLPTTGSYGGGDYHPAFIDKQKAEAYCQQQKDHLLLVISVMAQLEEEQ